MLSDFVFLTTARLWENLPGTYLWFALGPIIEGLVGGAQTLFRTGYFSLTKSS